MESSGPSGKITEPPNYMWSEIIGTTIAILTLTLPPLVISYYSSNSSVDLLPKTTYSLPVNRN